MRFIAYAIGLLVVLFVGTAVVASIVLDAGMLTEAGGPWMLLAYLVVPTAVAVFAFGPRLLTWIDEERAVRRGRRKLEEEERRLRRELDEERQEGA